MTQAYGSQEGEQRTVRSRSTEPPFAKVTRSFVVHQTQMARSLEDKLLWGIILCSWAGPAVSEFATLRDSSGFFVRPADVASITTSDVVSTTTSIPAKASDLRRLLNLPESSRGNISRALRNLEDDGSIKIDEDGLIYPLRDPRTPREDEDEPAAVVRTWRIADRVVSTATFDHLDAEARERVETWLEEHSTAWKNDLKDLRTTYREMLDEQLSSVGILIDKKEEILREPPPPPPQFVKGSDEGIPEQQPKAEEEDGRDLYQEFKTEYPDRHFDEPKAKPSFEKKPKAEKLHVLERLQIYRQSERWRDEDGRWIPLASNWLQSYESEPPPAIKKTKPGTDGAFDKEKLRQIAERAAEDRKWR